MSNSDFLSAFSKEVTQKTENEQSTQHETRKQLTKKELDASINKKIADEIVAAENGEEKSYSFKKTGEKQTPAQRKGALIKAPEHVVLEDKTFHKRKIIKYLLFSTTTVVMVFIGFLIFRMTNATTMPDWVNQEADSHNIRTWQINSRITPTIELAYSTEFLDGIIMSQSVAPGETVMRGSSVVLTVSRGADLNEIVPLPNFYEMTRAQINTFREQNRMRSINFSEENHPEIEANHVIRLEFSANADSEAFKRSDALTVVISRGPHTVQVPNMIGDERDEVDEFITSNPEINIELEFEPNQLISRGTVLRQSESPGMRLAHGATLTLTLSAGNPVEIPDFSRMRRIEALEFDEEELFVNVIERYHPTINYGRFISQDIESGTEVYDEDPAVTVTYSLGRPWIPRFSTVENIEREIVLINDDGASIFLDIRHINSYIDRGVVLRQSHYDQRVDLNQTILIEVSLGNLTRPEDDLNDEEFN